jgi:acylphosphatase
VARTNSPVPEGSVRRRVIVRGNVQGVFFRDSTREQAEQQGVSGWVSNRSDGAVEAVLEGPADAVERVLKFLHDGPSRADVDDVEVREEEPEDLSSFEVR